jgi:ribosomal protein S24E
MMTMKLIKTSENANALLGRKEVTFVIDHQTSGTPALVKVREAVASLYSANIELVYITKLKSLTGTTRTQGQAEIYDSLEVAQALVPKHIHKRNHLKES